MTTRPAMGSPVGCAMYPLNSWPSAAFNVAYSLTEQYLHLKYQRAPSRRSSRGKDCHPEPATCRYTSRNDPHRQSSGVAPGDGNPRLRHRLCRLSPPERPPGRCDRGAAALDRAGRSRMVPPEVLIDGARNTIVYEQEPGLRDHLFKLFATNHSP